MKFVFSLLFSILSAVCFVLAYHAGTDKIVGSWRWRLGFASGFSLLGLMSLGFNIFMLTYGEF